MASHFSCLGMPVDDEESYGDLCDQLFACITPFFAPDERVTWRVGEPRCEHCGGADCDLLDGSNELITRATVQWVHFQADREWLASPQQFELQVARFAHSASFAPDENALEGAQAELFGLDSKFRLAPEAFLPEGMFGRSNDIGARAIAWRLRIRWIRGASSLECVP